MEQIKRFGFLNSSIDNVRGAQEAQKSGNSEKNDKVEASREVQKIRLEAQKAEDKLQGMDFD